MTWELSRYIDLRNDRINETDARRQQATAAEICRRLNDQPGVILADEVGMGKTFVAFAVAVSVLHATKRRRPLVVMVPRPVSEKWPRDWSVFQQYCLSKEGPPIRASLTTIRRGSEFLKLLDNPAHRRDHLIFLTHGALSRSLNDPFIQLALVRQAFLRQGRLRRQRDVFPRWAATLLNDRTFTSERARRLIDTHPSTWGDQWARLGGQVEDDPVPVAALRALPHVDLRRLRAELAQIPLRSSPYIQERLRSTRLSLGESVQSVWRESLSHLRERLPLLILDEAHHVKNPTNLARLFDSAEAVHDADAVGASGPLAGMFERMLFLTATPFQLGHRELVSVLSRFSGARLNAAGRAELVQALDRLTTLLDAAQASSLRLERAWTRLTTVDALAFPDDDWAHCPEDAPSPVRTAASRAAEALEALHAAEEAMRPWVVRHTKMKMRSYRPGQQILRAEAPDVGLEISGPAIMPFLLAARAQALVSLHGLQEQRATRAYFAEGLASSFEAFVETRSQRAEDVMDDTVRPSDGDLPADVRWYVDRISETLPDRDPGNWSRHPKLLATTEAARQLWSEGNKVLIFCFYRATGRALRSHISRALLAEITARGAEALGLDGRDQKTVLDALEQRADTLLRSDAPGARVVAARVRAICARYGLQPEDTAQTIDVVTRFIRTASFLTRFVDLSASRGADAINAAFDRTDGSGARLEDRMADFAKLFASDALTEVERAGLWDALLGERRALGQRLGGIQTGSISTVSADMYDPGEISLRREATLPNVRLANGTVKAETRQRLMRTFNTPFFPEILVASSVMAEGVDLHLDCRHVIHHDLSWNPSTLEQRTGRLDRIGSKAERHPGTKIIVFEPYMAGTQDEKIYRVVKDRERWFNVVMGEQADTSEWATDQIADRVPVPESLMSALMVDLSVGDTPVANARAPIA